MILADRETSPLDEKGITFIRGNPSSGDDLNRAGLEHVSTVIVLADESNVSNAPDDVDARSLLTTLAVETINHDAYSCVEVIKSENRVHFERTHADELVVSAELTGSLLAASARTHGLSAVIADLLTHPEGQELYRVATAAGAREPEHPPRARGPEGPVRVAARRRVRRRALPGEPAERHRVARRQRAARRTGATARWPAVSPAAARGPDPLRVLTDGLGRTDRPARVAVIGAGMSGLVAASELRRAGHEPIVLEGQQRIPSSAPKGASTSPANTRRSNTRGSRARSGLRARRRRDPRARHALRLTQSVVRRDAQRESGSNA